MNYLQGVEAKVNHYSLATRSWQQNSIISHLNLLFSLLYLLILDPRHTRRTIVWKEKKDFSEYDQSSLPVQWKMWLRHTRRSPPTIQVSIRLVDSNRESHSSFTCILSQLGKERSCSRRNEHK